MPTALAPLTAAQLRAAASQCLSLQTTAQDLHAKRPFVALLLAPDNTTVLLSSHSLSHVRHAETEVARAAADNFAFDYLVGCTIVSSWEPCAMCAGSIYWANVGRLVYLASEDRLRELTGLGNMENLTLDLPCRKVFECGQRTVKVIGPVTEDGWQDKVFEDAARYWRRK